MTDKPDRPKHVALRNEKGHFVKGHSGNPKGKTAYMVTLDTGERVSVNDMYKRNSIEALGILTDMMNNPKTPAATRFNAAKYISDRAWGTPKQTVHLQDEREDDGSVQMNLKRMTDEALRQFVEANLVEIEAEIIEPNSETDGE